MIGIYKIENKINNKIYIGKSKNIMQRWSTHEQALEDGSHHSKTLQEDYTNMGGMSCFNFSIIEICDAKLLSEKEAFYIKKFNSSNIDIGYNAHQGEETMKDDITITRDSFLNICQILKPSYVSLYIYLLFVCDKDKKVLLNQSDLANILGVAPLTINNQLNNLIDDGIIKRIGKNGLYNIYQIVN